MEDKDLLDVYSAVSSFKGTENLFLDEEDFVEQINNNPDDVYEAISSFEGITNLFLDKEDFYTQTGLKKKQQTQPQKEDSTNVYQTVAEPLQESGGENKYTVNDTAVTREDILSKLDNEEFVEKIKSGDFNINIIDDVELQNKLKEKIQPPKYNKEFKEQDFFDGEFGAALKTLDLATPFGIGEFIDDMGRAISGGQKQGAIVDDALYLMANGGGASEEKIQDYIDAVEITKSQQTSDAMYNFQKEIEDKAKKNKDGKPDFFDVFSSLNMGVVPEIIVSSLSAMANPSSLTTGATVVGGAATGGALFGGVGAVPAAIASTPYAMATAGATLETAVTFSDLIQEELEKEQKAFNKNNVKTLLEDTKKLNSMRSKAAGRGITIGVIDALTGKLGGSVGAKITSKTFRGSKPLGVATTSAIEAVGGSTGEAAGQVVAGQEINPQEIVLEGIGEIGQAPIQLASALASGNTKDKVQAVKDVNEKVKKAAKVTGKPLYEMNGEPVSKEELNEIIESANVDDLEGMNVVVENDNQMTSKVESVMQLGVTKKKVMQANPNLDEDNVNKITELQVELDNLKENDTEVANDRKKQLKESINEIINPQERTTAEQYGDKKEVVIDEDELSTEEEGDVIAQLEKQIAKEERKLREQQVNDELAKKRKPKEKVEDKGVTSGVKALEFLGQEVVDENGNVGTIEQEGSGRLVFTSGNRIVELGSAEDVDTVNLGDYGLSVKPDSDFSNATNISKKGAGQGMSAKGKVSVGEAEADTEAIMQEEEFKQKSEEELNKMIEQAEKDVALAEEIALEEAAQKSKNRDLVKIGDRIFQVTKKDDGTFAISQKTDGGKLVAVRDKETRRKAEGAFKSEKSKAEAQALAEAQKQVDDFRAEEQDKIEKFLDDVINATSSKGRAFDATLGIPMALVNTSAKVLKAAYKAGKSLAGAIEDAIKHIEKQGYKVNKLEYQKYILQSLKGQTTESGAKKPQQKQSTAKNATAKQKSKQQESEGKEDSIISKGVTVEGATEGIYIDVEMIAGKDGRKLTPEEVLDAIPIDGIEFDNDGNNLMIKLPRELTSSEMMSLMKATEQEAIGQLSNGTGKLYAQSKKLLEDYGNEFNEKFFKTPRKEKLKKYEKSTAGNRLFNKPLKAVKEIANRYYKRIFGGRREEFFGTKKIDKKFAKRISDAYEAMKHDPNNPEVKAAYDALIKETLGQYQDIIDAGYVIEINNNEPYNNSQDMITDLEKNKTIKILSTESEFGDKKITNKQREENPMLAETKYKDKNGLPLLANDIFRAVHDFFGHAELGNGFGPLGEENAWNVHARMYSPLARRAMTTETRGQNSWVNFSGINDEAFKKRDRARQLRREGKEEEAKALAEEVYNEMFFAEQKVGLLPEEFSELSDNYFDEQEVKDLETLTKSKQEQLKEKVKEEIDSRNKRIEKAKESAKSKGVNYVDTPNKATDRSFKGVLSSVTDFIRSKVYKTENGKRVVNDYSLMDFMSDMKDFNLSEDLLKQLYIAANPEIKSIDNKRENAIKNIARNKLGVELGRKLINIAKIPFQFIEASQLDKYLEAINWLGQRTSVFSGKEFNEKKELLDEVLSYAEYALGGYNDVLQEIKDGIAKGKTYNEVIEKMLEDKKITASQYNFFNKNKPRNAPTKGVNVPKKPSKVTSLTAGLTEMERDAVNTLKDVSQEDFDMLSDEEKLVFERLVDAVNGGFIPSTIYKIEKSIISNRQAKDISNSIRSYGNAIITKIKDILKFGKKPNKAQIIKRISPSSSTTVDSAAGMKGEAIQKTMNGVAKAISLFNAKMNKIANEMSQLMTALSPKKAMIADIKIFMYNHQTQKNSNKDNKTVDSVKDFVERINKNESDKNAFIDTMGKDRYDIIMDLYKKYSDSNGEVSVEKIYKDMSIDEKRIYNLSKKIVDTLKEYAYGAAAYKGEMLVEVANYAHTPVLMGVQKSEMTPEQMTDRFLGQGFKAWSISAGTLKERVVGTPVTNFSNFSSVVDGARKTLQDYYLRKALQIESATLDKVRKEFENNKDLVGIADGISAGVKAVRTAMFANEIANEKVSPTIMHLFGVATRSMLGTFKKFVVEGVTNTLGIVLNEILTGKMFKGETSIIEYLKSLNKKVYNNALENLAPKQLERLISGEVYGGYQTDVNANQLEFYSPYSKTADRKIAEFMNKYLSNWAGLNIKGKRISPKAFAEYAVQFSDQVFARGVFFRDFKSKFKQITGVSPDMILIGRNDAAYMDKYSEALKKSVDAGDAAISQFFNSTNKAEKSTDQLLASRGILTRLSYYMLPFRIAEYQNVKKAIYNDGVIKGGIQVALPMIARNAAYQIIMGEAIRASAAYMFGDDDDKEEFWRTAFEKDDIKRGLVSSLLSLLVFRNAAMVKTIGISFAIEALNYTWGDKWGLRKKGETYDPYKNNILFTKLTFNKPTYKNPTESFIDALEVIVPPLSPTTNALQSLAKSELSQELQVEAEMKKKVKKDRLKDEDYYLRKGVLEVGVALEIINKDFLNAYTYSRNKDFIIYENGKKTPSISGI